jgi:hypothetical protein
MPWVQVTKGFFNLFSAQPSKLKLKENICSSFLPQELLVGFFIYLFIFKYFLGEKS